MIEHRSLPIVRLQKTRMVQIFCSRFCERASIRSPPGEPSLPNFFSDRRIYDAAIILSRIQGGTEPMWSRVFCTRLTIEHGRQFARLLPIVEHRPTPAQLSERGHARATQASLLAGISPGPRRSASARLETFFFVFRCCFFALFLYRF